MRFRGCPATGRLMHVFDKQTHRCKCGRYERGYAPKKEPVRPRAECQICERKQAIDGSGNLGHHGYRRPGWGCIEGDCMGVGYKPYPATDALELYLAAVRGHISRCRERLAGLPELTEIEYHYPVYVNHKKEDRVRVIRKGDVYHYDAEARQCWPSFEDQIRIETAKLENEIAYAEKDERRVVKRIVLVSELKVG